MVSISRTIFRWMSLLSLFLYLFPFQLKALPLSNVRILQITGLVCLFIYIIHHRRIPRSIITYIFWGCCVFFLGVMSVVINGSGQFDFALSKGIYIILYASSSFFIIGLMKKAYKPFLPLHAFESLVWVTAIQAVISLLFFCFPNILEVYNSIVILDDEASEKIETLNAFRLTGVGSVQYANAAVHYGIALWFLILLYFSRGSSFYCQSWLIYILAPLFCVCGVLSARTFFIILLLTVVYVVYLVGYNNIYLVLKTLRKVFIPILLAGSCVIFYMVAHNLDFILEWAMELFINWADSGNIESASTNELKEMYVLPRTIKTWIIGDGMSSNEFGGFYMGSDVGYIRSLYYWGIIGSIVYYVAHYKYVSVLKDLFNDVKIKRLINIIFVWFFIYNMKEFWAVEPYWVFLLFVALYAKQSYVKCQSS